MMLFIVITIKSNMIIFFNLKFSHFYCTGICSDFFFLSFISFSIIILNFISNYRCINKPTVKFIDRHSAAFTLNGLMTRNETWRL